MKDFLAVAGTALGFLIVGIFLGHQGAMESVEDEHLARLELLHRQTPRLVGYGCEGEDGRIEPVMFADREDQFPGRCKEIVLVDYDRG